MMTDPRKLPKTSGELEAIIRPHESRTEYLEMRLIVLERTTIASGSEKRRPDEDEGGRHLHAFNEADELVEKGTVEKPSAFPGRTRRRTGRKPLASRQLCPPR
jgi:hypothetical protein